MVLGTLVSQLKLSPTDRTEVVRVGAQIVKRVRAETTSSMMEAFLAEYGLSTGKSVGLMCLAEALLRIPMHGEFILQAAIRV